MTSTDAKLLASEADYFAAAWGGLLVMTWRVNTTAHAVSVMRSVFWPIMAAHPTGTAMLTIVEVNAPMPDLPAREAVAGFMRDVGASVRASALVSEGAGFRAAAVRGVVTGLTMLARQPYPHKVFATVDDAGRWLVPLMPPGSAPRPGADALVSAIANLRAQLDRR
jgi:hypothetical protein